MHFLSNIRRLALLPAIAIAITLAACGGGGYDNSPPPQSTRVQPGYLATTLVTGPDASAPARQSLLSDSRLVDAWGIAIAPRAFAWVANQGSSSSTQYDGDGGFVPLVVELDDGRAGKARPTGVVFNGSQNFAVSRDGRSGTCSFIVVGAAGTVNCWAPDVNAPERAIQVFDGAALGAVYTGAAIDKRGVAIDFLLAADFHNGRVDIFGGDFTRMDAAPAFVDPELPADHAPFGIQTIGDRTYIAYAKRDAQDLPISGAGLGRIAVFDTNGRLLKRLVGPGGRLNVPWGMAQAPADFGQFSNALLVANVGDGRINAFDIETGAFLGALAMPSGAPIVIDGLRGIAFGQGLFEQASDAASLFYTAGPAAGSQGAYGRIDSR
jgi:uncharacterized protein (TIGR03118 family)